MVTFLNCFLLALILILVVLVPLAGEYTPPAPADHDQGDGDSDALSGKLMSLPSFLPTSKEEIALMEATLIEEEATACASTTTTGLRLLALPSGTLVSPMGELDVAPMAAVLSQPPRASRLMEAPQHFWLVDETIAA